jgi:antitoxin (DNA-binding transcriptional repressor) of toxin-antitoxin stability system
MTIAHDYGDVMSQEHVTKTQFKAKALEYFRQVETSGDSVVITDRGQPTVEVRRYRSDQRSPLEILRGSVVEYKKPTEPVAEDDWEALS